MWCADVLLFAVVLFLSAADSSGSTVTTAEIQSRILRNYDAYKARNKVQEVKQQNYVPSPSNQYRDDRVCKKNIEMTGFCHTILKCPQLGDLIFMNCIERR